MSRQLPLGIRVRPELTLTGFVPGRNGEVLAQIEQLTLARGDPFIYLWSASGCGKSHLLQAACSAVAKGADGAAYIPLAEHAQLDPAILQGLEHTALVCLDDVQAIAGLPDWEQALFHLFNRLRESRRRLLVAANSPPEGLGIDLPDLRSRLTWGPCYRLHPLNDEDQVRVLRCWAGERGLKLSDEAGRYLQQRSARDMHSLEQLIGELDQASLAAQRALTIPFLKDFLASR